jgi:CDP-4-dehydro-6-deoxyglucose reductase
MTYVVHIKPGNHTLYVNEGESVLDAALRQEFIFPYSCQSAVCGTCSGTVLQGEIEYYDPEAVELSDDEREAGIALFCSAMPTSDLIIEVEGVIAPSDLPCTILPYTLSHQEALSQKMQLLILSPSDEDHIHYRAGQYVNLINSRGQKQAYSIANAPTGGRQIELHLRHAPGNEFTQQLLVELNADKTITIEGPLGHVLFQPKPNTPIIMLAGGSGFAQMKSLFEQSTYLNNQLPIHLFWVVRELEDFYSELPQQWQAQYPHFKFTPVLSQSKDGWSGASGRVYEVISQHYPDLSKHQMYASGPPEMVMQTLQHLQQHGLSRNLMYADALAF